MNHKQLLKNLKRLGINDAIAIKNAMADGSPAIVLRRDGDEHYYTGFGSEFSDDPEIEKSLVARFADKRSLRVKERPTGMKS